MKKRKVKTEYLKKYMLERYHKRMEHFHTLLGNKCCICGSTENLDIDHIDPKSKQFTIAAKAASAPMAILLEELSKCQLLCRMCHNAKTLENKGLKSAKGTHGTLSAYRYCHCDLCRKAVADYTKERRNRK